jgi:hypothetical protein
MIERILLFILGVCIMLMSIVTLTDPNGYYMRSIEGILITLFIGSIGLTMILASFYSIFFKE